MHILYAVWKPIDFCGSTSNFVGSIIFLHPNTQPGGVSS